MKKKKGLMMLVASLLAFAGVANAYTLIEHGDWTLTGSSSGATSTSAATWDSLVYTAQTLDTANLTAVISTLKFTSTGLLGPTISDRPFATITLTVVNGSGNLTTYSDISEKMQGGTAIDVGGGKYTYEFGAVSPASISVFNNKVGFFLTEGSGTRSFDISFTLYDSSETVVSSGYTVDGTGRVDVSYVYNGTPVPEPATGALALAGIGMLFARRRRREA